MTTPARLDPAALTAIDVHVHLEAPEVWQRRRGRRRRSTSARVARRAAPRRSSSITGRASMACVVFTVDERLTGRPAGLERHHRRNCGADHPDVVIPFVSIDPTRGPEAVREARRLLAGGGVRGLKLHPPLQQFAPNDRIAYPLYEVFAEAKLPVLFHTGHSGIGTGMPGGGGVRLEVRQSDAGRRCGRGLSRNADHPGASVVSLAGRGDLCLPAQADRLHRSLRLVAEVFSREPHSVREHVAQDEGACSVRTTR